MPHVVQMPFKSASNALKTKVSAILYCSMSGLVDSVEIPERNHGDYSGMKYPSSGPPLYIIDNELIIQSM